MLRLVTLILPLGLVACVESGDEGIYVLNNTAPPSGSCSLTGGADQPFLSHGTVNYLSPVAYVMTPLIQSRIQPVMGVDDQSKTVQLRGADVALTLKAVTIHHPDDSFTTTQPNKMLQALSVLFSGSLGPGASINTFVDAIPPGTLRQIAAMSGANLTTDSFQAEVLASVVIRGVINEDTITSSTYEFPITVCNDCVIRNLGACPLPAMTTVSAGNACNPFQDGVVDCCTDAANGLVCPAPVAM